MIAVEPHEGMRKALVEKKLEGNLKVLDGDAEHIPVEGGVDAVIAAQVRDTSPPATSQISLLTVRTGIPLVCYGRYVEGAE